MRTEEEIREAYRITAESAEEVDKVNEFQSIGPIILCKGFEWVLEENQEENEEFFEKLTEEVNEIINQK